MEGPPEAKKKKKVKHESIGYPCYQFEHIATEICLLKNSGIQVQASHICSVADPTREK